ncbi:amino acid adenylation domain-containing protein [Corallococcus sp. CA047B]|uniref:non-ribosomal peptide synthase/polyketide synthase n=1 Tax=Corallococcus sp. CA047B TaxID=2316729 RepID=UPI000EA0558C|nr:non-ribosomal peptide synthase/polyketide synthase [Corallococcus sp. CA047B]RKH18898.1 amino acid adenylation domain-containing protein [Corallococcus sp. CA047B]
MRTPTSISGHLELHAAAQPHRLAYRYLTTGDSDGPVETLTWAELDRRVRAVAAALQRAGATGERALLLYPPGLDFVVAFLGCLASGVIAAPAYPPDPGRLERTLGRLRAIARDCDARLVLTTAAIAGMAEALHPMAPELGELQWVASDAVPDDEADAWRRPALATSGVAFLQYTSGSTGTPKGVVITHDNLLHNERMLKQGFGHSIEGSSGVGWLPLYHDMGLIGNVLQPLYIGMPCTLMSPLAFLQRPSRWLRAISTFRGTTSGGPNFAYDLCVRKVTEAERAGLDLSSWDVAFNGAEPVRTATLERFAAAFAAHGFRREVFYPCYGLAESTLFVTGPVKAAAPPVVVSLDVPALEQGRVVPLAEESHGARTLVGCGHTWLEQRVAIVDPVSGRRAGDDSVGEIWVSGPSVARGYWNNPEATAKTFEARIADTGEGPFLRTGDLGFQHGGALFVTGRLKDLIIVRGRNLYPQDVELTAEQAHTAVRQGCAAAFGLEVAGEEQLVVVAEVDERAGTPAAEVAAAIREAVAAEHGVVVHAVALLQSRTLPKTTSGKVQRHACRNAFVEGTLSLVSEVAFAPARVEPSPEDAAAQGLEAWLFARIAALTGTPVGAIDPGQPFAHYGMDSKDLVGLSGDLETRLDRPVSPALLYEQPSLTALLRHLEGSTEQGQPVPISRSEQLETEPGPLSAGGARLLVLDRLAPGSALYNIHAGLSMKGALDAGALRRSLNALVTRHPMLRATFPESEGRPGLVISGPALLALPVVDLRDLPLEKRQAELARLSEEHATAPFDLTRGPLVRLTLVALRDAEHVLLLTQHHIITDAWSIGVFARELAELYEGFRTGSPRTLAELPVRYADYVRWQDAWLQGEDARRSVAWWKQKLAGLPRLDFPTPRTPGRGTTHAGDAYAFALPAGLTSALKDLARRESCTLYVALLTAWATLLHRYSHQQADFGIGTVTAGRDRRELRDVVGFFVNTLVLRCDLSGDPEGSVLMRRLRGVVEGALRHQEVPFDQVVSAVGAPRGQDLNPLFRAGFVLENVPFPELALPGLTWTPVLQRPDGGVPGTAKFDLGLSMVETNGGLSAAIEYATDLFDAATIERMAGHFQRLVEGLVEAPRRRVSELSLLTAGERHRLLSEWNETAAEQPRDVCLHELFEAQARTAPGALAVSFGAQRLTYGELNRRANQLAHHLRGLGVGPEVRVGLCMERSVELVVGLLGILKAGGAYLPLDPTYPADRLSFMLEDARSPVLVTMGRLRETVRAAAPRIVFLDDDRVAIAARSGDAPATGVQRDNLAYVIYTSGSSGRPKGVENRHGGLTNLVRWFVKEYAVVPADRVAQQAVMGFDACGLELWPALSVGASVHIVDEETRFSSARLVEWFQREAITLAHLPPVLAEAIVEGALPAGFPLRALLTGSDKVQRAPRHAPPFRFTNHYGPTEAAILATWSPIQASEGMQPPPIGRPLPGVRVYVLDPHLQPVPIGVPGELYIGGRGLGRGYAHRPDLTAERFIPDAFGPEAGARLYRTGDLVRYRADGVLEFLGRADHQVKIRGFRIELAEIESVLAQHPSVRDAVVLAREDAPGDKQLVAYVVPREGQSPGAGGLRSHLRGKLPDFMMPGAFVELPVLPVTPNGKVDRKALPPPDLTSADLARDFVAPRTPVEEVLATVWAQVLRVPRVSLFDSFFDLGGHSLLAMQVLGRVRTAFGVDVPLRALFETPTVAAVAALVEAAMRAGTVPTAPALVPAPREGLLPLSFAQQRLWLLDRLDPDSPLYNVPAAVNLSGPLNAIALEQALQALVQRHEALRTIFPSIEGQPHQAIAPELAPRLKVVELHTPEEAAWQAEVQRLAKQEAETPFDLARGPLLRATLLKRSEQEHVLLLTLHHIVSDGWSLGVLVREVAALYEAASQGRASSLPALPIQYADYALWQRQWLSGEVLKAELSWWKQYLAGAPPALELPTDRPRPSVRSHRGSVLPVALPRELSSALAALSRREGSTLFMTLLAAFQVLLHRHSGQDDIVVGSPIAGRTRAETEGLIGFFVNTLVLRTDLSGEPSFRELLKRVREVTLGAYVHQDVPFEKLVEELAPARDLSRSPLFQVMFVLQNAPMPELSLGEAKLTPMPVAQTVAKFELTLFLEETADGLKGSLEYNTDLFDAGTVERLAGHYQTLLEGIVAEPEQSVSRLPLLTEPEHHQLVRAFNQTQTNFPRERCIHELFEAQAKKTPNAVAVVFEDQRLTYRELDQRANQLGHHLRSMGVGPEVLVGLCVERSLELVVGLLGILKAGGAYLPLDPSYPEERLAFMLEDSGTPILLTQRQRVDGLPKHRARTLLLDTDWEHIARERMDKPESGGGPEGLAYVIYTSGSTGKPNGVMIPHRGLVNYLAWCTQAYDVVNGRGAPVHSSISFDLTITGLFSPLLVGQPVVLLPERDGIDVLVDALDRHDDFSLVKLTPAHLELIPRLLRPERAAGRARALVIGGEALSWEALSFFQRSAPATRLINEYGPTETVVGCCIYEAPADVAKTGPVPIGRPIANTRLYVLDARLQPVPLNVPGELYIGGAGVGRGYRNRPALTAERFRPDPFSDEPDARLYKTGDLCRWLPDGNLEYLGRADHQVKLRGFRIELGEIESILSQHPSVRQAVVIAREDAPGEKRLVAYVVGHETPLPGLGELRSHLQGRLPDYMVPTAFVALPVLPLTPNGKVDRKALPPPDLASADLARDFVGPRTPVEEVLATVWAQVLRVPRVSLFDSFFDLGGHSLLAMQVLGRVRIAFGVDVPLRALFETPTVAAVAALVEAAMRAGASPAAPALVPAPREGLLPLSFAQQRLWLLDRLEPDSPLYNVPTAVHLSGPLNASALEQALQALVQRHEALRTTFPNIEGQPHQAIASELALRLKVVELHTPEEAAWQAEVQRLAKQEAETPFDLAHGPLLRATLLKRSEQEHVLLLTLHHIVSDGWSLGVLIRELGALHAGHAASLPALPIQYADYALWQRQWLSGEVLKAELSWWKQHLAGAPPALELPTDRPRPSVRSHRGSVLPVALPRELSSALAALSRREGSTLFMTLLAAFQVLLHRHSGQDDIVVGSPIAGRTRAETEGLIGFFVNTLVLRTDLSGEPSFRELLKRVREVTLGAYVHQDVPFEKLVEELAPARDLSRSPLFQVMFVLQNAPMPELSLGEAKLTPMPVAQTVAKFELTLFLEETADGLKGSLEYNTDLFDAETVERLAGHYQTLLKGIVAEPEQSVSRLPLLTEAEHLQLVRTFNQTRTDFPREHCIHELFEAQAKKTPDAVAVVFEDQRLTYRELDQRANQLGHHLRSMGVGPEVLVGLCVERSLELVVGLLGILKAGGAYLPLDPNYPEERLAFMLEDTGTPLLLTQRHLVERLPARRPQVLLLDEGLSSMAGESIPAPVSGAGPESLAYVVYTSGSTGRPKGVCVVHRGVVRLVKETRYAHFSETETFLHLASLSFDASTFELWGPLLNGGRLVVFPVERPTLATIGEVVRREGVTTLWLTASLFNAVMDAQPEVLRPLRQLLVGGEALSVPHVKRALEVLPGVRLINGYGPTESTTFACCHTITEADGVTSIPLGRPIANTEAYVLDRHARPVPVGVAGELYLGGDGLARGYLNRPELTAGAFVPHPFSADPRARLYKTGDLVRVRPDGNLEFLGRLDHQVKLRGFRIELGEIEEQLGRHPSIREVVVLAREDVPGEKRLVAYLVAHEGTLPGAGELRSYLQGKLPEFMVPAAFVELPALPLSSNGKVDRKALPPPDLASADPERAFVGPRTPVEETLVALWAELLSVPRVGVFDSFFALGGHSLLAMKVLGRVRTAFGIDVPLRALFEGPTTAALAQHVEAALRARGDTLPFASTPAGDTLGPLAADVVEPPVLVPPRASYPLSPSQRRYWRDYVRDPQRTWSNISAAVPLGGALLAEPIERAINLLIARHESLRTAFPMEGGERVQVVASEARCVLTVTDLTRLAPEHRASALADIRRGEANRLFNLEAAPLLRAHLVQAGEGQSLLFMTGHHLIVDGWSLFLMRQELAALYVECLTGSPSTLEPLKLQYKDFSEWQNRLLAQGAFEPDRRYWLEHLAPPLPPVPFADFVHPEAGTDRTGAAYRVLLPGPLWDQVKHAAGVLGVSPFVLLLTGFFTLIHDQEGSRDIIIGTPVNGRDANHFPSLIGLAINLVMLRVRLEDGDTFASCAAKVQFALLSAMQHQSYQNDRILADLGFDPGADSFALTTSFFSALNVEAPVAPEFRAAGAVHEVLPTEVRFDVMWYAVEYSDGMVLDCRYCGSLFPRDVVEKQVARYLELLEHHLPTPRALLASLAPQSLSNPRR